MTSLFSHLLKKGEKFIWDKNLDNIKRYLTNALVLASYYLENSLLLYVLEKLSALGVMLA